MGDRLTARDFEALPGVQACEFSPRRVVLTVASVHATLPAMLRLLDRHEVALQGLATRHATLEDVFVHLTGRHLREGEKE
jgi:ABC-2 type transport system ATP-binding protein